MKVFKCPGIVTGISTLSDGGLSIKFSSQELTDEEILEIIKFKGKFGWVLFKQSEKAISDDEIPDMDPESMDESKSPSQRLRATLWVLARQRGIDPSKFQDYYVNTMEKLIQTFKNKLT